MIVAVLGSNSEVADTTLRIEATKNHMSEKTINLSGYFTIVG